MEFRCIHCGSEVKALFVQYSPGNIRLMKCENCKVVADEYIECEITILLIDLILHKRKAYRHLLYNLLNRDAVDVEGIMWKSSFLLLFFELCRNLIIHNSKEGLGSSTTSLSSIWVCGKMLTEVILENFVFFSVLLLPSRFLLNSLSPVTRYKEVFLAIVVSSYFKIFLIAMMVWEFPFPALYIVDVFVLSSNAVALKVLTQSMMIGCIGVCIGAHAAKFATSHLLEIKLVDWFLL
ncbi:protein ARV 2-like [Tasmannia lanceolata]|uniref:protein ARV 2-like n=1 Tax=Tasmannia lanceolata TaxID=3420 RepID=UPI0040645F73